MSKSFFRITSIVLSLFILSFYGAHAHATEAENPESSFLSVGDVNMRTSDIIVPTVFEVPFNRGDFRDREIFLVKDLTTTEYVPSYYKTIVPTETYVSVASDVTPSVGQVEGLARNLLGGYAEFALPATGNGFVTLTLTYREAVTASSLSLLLAPHVAYPRTTSISVVRDGVDYPLLRGSPASQYFGFPETTGKVWKVTFEYAQPLRIERIILDRRSQDSTTGVLRFLAKPKHDYRVFYDADRSVVVSMKEGGNLSGDKGLDKAVLENKKVNVLYKAADVDADSIPDTVDNCIYMANQDQKDIDGNGSGDVCDDFDRDGVVNVKDNCPNDPNYAQTDTDGDKIGDACDDKESRYTEAHKWVPWAGMGAAALVLIILGYFMISSGGLPKNDELT